MLRLTENHEPDSMETKEPFHEVEGESAQAIAVGNHDLLESSSVRELQNLEQPAPLEVDSGPDVPDDAVFGEAFPHEFDLAFEIGLLADGRDAAIAYALPSGNTRRLHFFRGCGGSMFG